MTLYCWPDLTGDLTGDLTALPVRRGRQNSSPHASFESFVKEDLDSLPPNQRRKRIQGRMDELAAKISQETSTR